MLLSPLRGFDKLSMTSTTRTPYHVNQLLLRDGQQSTLKTESINFDPIAWAKILSHARGFKSAEVAGGQSFQSAIRQGHNPFNMMEYLDLCTRDGRGTRAIDLQMLFRGANALGFRHYSPDLIEAVLNEFIRLGINKIRFFDALNDIDNIYIPESVKAKVQGSNPVELQGALCFGSYPNQPARYSDQYYVNYAKALMAKGCTSIAIKDMSGQLDASRATSLIQQLRRALPEVRLELHMHSTNHEKSLAAVKAAIEAGVDGIETVEGPLAGGASHHSLASIDPAKAQSLPNYQALLQEANRVFARLNREDAMLDPEIKSKLCQAGVPGGAMPFVVKDLRESSVSIARNNRDYFMEDCPSGKSFEDMLEDGKWRFEKAMNLFLKELPRVCDDANFPLLVTPTADICTKQAIYNLKHGSNIQSDELQDRYDLSTNHCDERFVKLILGHYGQMKSYSSPEDKGFEVIDSKVVDFFETNKLSIRRQTEQPYTKILREHTSDTGELVQARQSADVLINKHGYKALSFASREQLAIIYLLAPPGHGDLVEAALQKYIAKTEKDYHQGRRCGAPIREGFEYLFEPLFKHIDVLAALGRKAGEALSMKLADFGNLGTRLYEVYSNLPVLQRVRDFVENNVTSACSLLDSIGENVTLDFNRNYLVLKSKFQELVSSFENFQNSSLKDLIINLVKLDRISSFLSDSEGIVEMNRDPNFANKHIKQGNRIEAPLSQVYFPNLERQERWQNASNTH